MLKLTSLALLLSLLLSGCVTETNGGFNVDASDERALEDYLQLGMGYLEQGDLANARRHLNNAMAINSKNSDVYGVWGLLHSREGDVELADNSFKQALRIDSKNSRARNNYAAFLFSNEKFKEAYEQLEIVVEDTAYSARPQAFENMGLSALRLNEPDDAEYAFTRAVQLNSNQLRSTLELAELNINKGNTAQARAYHDGFMTLISFYNIEPSAQSLWVGIQLENGSKKSREYAELLQQKYPNTTEYKLYQQSLSGSTK